ncbi:outer membrane beta-barrel protein [Pseudoalteromonas sp. NBT06-2]|uniref:outer membrane beta-barrel protein n=1 Tax=Pseudoalteromonas sp. NBT06-2 TaxID=2025950 RepID=UPI0014828896|nr:outer membrane beta-barrel protein [Pseudoalteromonas sp. NBT06-2]
MILSSVLALPQVHAKKLDFYLGASYLNATSEFLGESNNDTGFEGRLGYNLSEYFSIELSAFEFGDIVFSGNSKFNGHIDSFGAEFAAIGKYPLANKLSLTGKLGGLWGVKEGSLIVSNAPGNSAYRSDGVDITFGIGLSYNLTHNVEVKIDYNDSKSVSWASVGLNYSF